MNGFFSLSRAMLLRYSRDRSTVFFTILFPLMFLILFGGIFKDSDGNRPNVAQIGTVPMLGAVSEPPSPPQPLPPPGETSSFAPSDSAEISPQGLELGMAVNITRTPAADKKETLEKVNKGDYAAAFEQQGDTLVLYYSAANHTTASTVQSIFSGTLSGLNQAATGQPPRFILDTQQVEDTSLNIIQYLTPGLLGWAIAMNGAFGAALTLVTWRERKVLRRLRLAPVNTSTIVLSRVGVSGIVALVQTAAFLSIASLPYFGLQLTGWWPMSIPLILAGTLAFMSIGLLAGAWAKTAETASAMVNIVVLPMAFLSGAFFPLDSAPTWLQTLSKLLPMKYLVTGMQDLMVRGEGPSAVVLPLVVLLSFTAVVSLIASRVFRWDDV